MTDLSPAAQAVLDAALDVDFCIEFPAALSPAMKASVQRVAATSIRAAADQVVPEVSEPDWGDCNEMRCDIELYADHQRKRAALLAIADELEGQAND
jgi:hypothetical protein